MTRLIAVVLIIVSLGCGLPTSAVLAASETVTIFYEDFEDPLELHETEQAGWNSFADQSNHIPQVRWGRVDSSFGGEGTHRGNWKGYCAATGYEGTASSPTYPTGTRPYMQLRLDLSKYETAYLSFWYKTPSLGSGDCFEFLIHSEPGINLISSTWREYTYDLSSRAGSTQIVFLDWRLVSNNSDVGEGAYVDDILITGTLKDIRSAEVISVGRNQTSYKPNDWVILTPSVKNTGNVQLRIRTVAYIKDQTGQVVYDSHVENNDIDMWLNPNEIDDFHEFSWQVPHDTNEGDYSVSIESRDWENWNIIYDTDTSTSFHIGRNQPAVSTLDASAFTDTSATLNGRLDDTGGLDCQVWFEYGLSTSYGNSTGSITKSVANPFSNAITGLLSGVTYHYRACATNGGPTVYGNDKTFATEQGTTRPDVATNPASNFQATSATLNGELISTGDLDCMIWFKYGTSTNYDMETPHIPKSSVGPFNQIITGLFPDTTYHFKAYASNAQDIACGVDRTFTTGGDTYPPEVTTLPVIDFTSTSATLRGNLISTGNLECEVFFEYGTTSSYGTRTLRLPRSSTGEFSITVTGLEPGIEYHYFAYAENALSTTHGNDRDFTTNEDTYAPEVITYKATDITPTSAILHGELVSTGNLECEVWFEYGESQSYGTSSGTLEMSSNGEFTIEISNLENNMSCHYRACASNIQGKRSGQNLFFITSSTGKAPEVIEVIFEPTREAHGIIAGSKVKITVKAWDPDGDHLTYIWGGPNITTRENYLIWEVPQEPGWFDFDIVVSDGQNTTSALFERIETVNLEQGWGYSYRKLPDYKDLPPVVSEGLIQGVTPFGAMLFDMEEWVRTVGALPRYCKQAWNIASDVVTLVDIANAAKLGDELAEEELKKQIRTMASKEIIERTGGELTAEVYSIGLQAAKTLKGANPAGLAFEISKVIVNELVDGLYSQIDEGYRVDKYPKDAGESLHLIILYISGETGRYVRGDTVTIKRVDGYKFFYQSNSGEWKLFRDATVTIEWTEPIPPPPPQPDIVIKYSDNNIPTGETKDIILEFTNIGEGTLKQPSYYFGPDTITSNQADLEPGIIQKITINVSSQDYSAGEAFTKIVKITGMYGNSDNSEFYEKVFPITFNSRGTPGDADGDNQVNEDDFEIIRDIYGKSHSESGYERDVDINGDGVIDYKDLAISAANSQ